MNFEGDESLDEALRQGADACAHPNKLISCLAPSLIASAGPNLPSPVSGMIFDLHLPKDIGADPFGKLWNIEVPIVFPVTLFVIEGHASNSINRREGRCHRREGFARGRSRSEGEVVGVRAGASLQEPWSVRFRRQNRHEPFSPAT